MKIRLCLVELRIGSLGQSDQVGHELINLQVYVRRYRRIYCVSVHNTAVNSSVNIYILLLKVSVTRWWCVRASERKDE